LFKNARPDPDFKYFSKLKALYLSKNITKEINCTGVLLEVAGTDLLLCLASRSSTFFVHPTYKRLSEHFKIYTKYMASSFIYLMMISSGRW